MATGNKGIINQVLWFWLLTMLIRLSELASKTAKPIDILHN